jgi:hypothetical protein
MATKSVSLKIYGDDLKLLEKIKRVLLSSDGKVSNTAVIRKALRALDQELNQPKTEGE